MRLLLDIQCLGAYLTPTVAVEVTIRRGNIDQRGRHAWRTTIEHRADVRIRRVAPGHGAVVRRAGLPEHAGRTHGNIGSLPPAANRPCRDSARTRPDPGPAAHPHAVPLTGLLDNR